MQERDRARDVLDVEDLIGPVPILDQDAAVALLRTVHRIAIMGASPDPGRPSYGVMRYLTSHGYACVPVNPFADEVLGMTCHATLEEAAAVAPIELVDVFRRAEHAPAIARSAVAVGARGLWLQRGIVNWEAAGIAHDAGLVVVMDRCTAIDHRRVGQGGISGRGSPTR